MKAPSPNSGDPGINGNYIATLFAFRTPKFETWREIDIEVTGNATNAVTTNVINGDQRFEWMADFADANEAIVDGIDTRTEFHDFAFEWLPDSITWYVDGEMIRQYTTDSKLPIPELSAKIMMNLWIFNNTAAFGGPDLENNMYPMTSEYEWFRFYKWDQEDTYPCTAMNESCLSADDTNLSSNNPCDGISAAGDIVKVGGATSPACTTTCPY
jgi:beta-glucanase (GH16 family)